ncbi:hypothetical protein ACSAZK_06515 [Methanosarcina sp. Mfa9]
MENKSSRIGKLKKKVEDQPEKKEVKKVRGGESLKKVEGRLGK